MVFKVFPNSPSLKLTLVMITITMSFASLRAQQETDNRPSLEPEVRENSNLKDEKKDIRISKEMQIFKALFQKRRQEQLEAVTALRKMDSYDKVYKLINLMMDNIFLALEKNQDILHKNGFFPEGDNSFPKEESAKEAYSSILENTALFGDIVLHVPNITHRILKKHHKNWNNLVKWSLNLSNHSKHLLDKSTATMIHLLEQELNFKSREEGYSNPFWKKANFENDKKEELLSRQDSRKENKKKKKLQRGPRITRNEL